MNQTLNFLGENRRAYVADGHVALTEQIVADHGDGDAVAATRRIPATADAASAYNAASVTFGAPFFRAADAWSRALPGLGTFVTAFETGAGFAAAAIPSAGSYVAANANSSLAANSSDTRTLAAKLADWGIADPVAQKQWYLGKIGDLGAIWADYTGKGVSVGIYDSGVDIRVSDVAKNYDASKEAVVNGARYDGSWRPLSGPHGTAVAGVIAGARDGEGIVGIAYDSSITSVNIFDAYPVEDGIRASSSMPPTAPSFSRHSRISQTSI